MWTKIGISIRSRHLFGSKTVANWTLLKYFFSLHTCAKCSVQPSNIGIRNAIMKVIRLHKVISNWFRGKTQKHLFPALLSFKWYSKMSLFSYLRNVVRFYTDTHYRNMNKTSWTQSMYQFQYISVYINFLCWGFNVFRFSIKDILDDNKSALECFCMIDNFEIKLENLKEL